MGFCCQGYMSQFLHKYEDSENANKGQREAYTRCISMFFQIVGDSDHVCCLALHKSMCMDNPKTSNEILN